ncbi:hypothetical protein CBR_g54993 [Chara braunii]|uniref:Uncharacterized protein n=1 Tax=Chara braunii TaxID=69332 RepID=A0A388K7U6_CHABU|nr:hypothetical protein CBR_g54993 [Chara braunii]|eukprot:GBG66013.1 hypothetical protein CBR_g54993 [Chara braunii]
MRGKPKAKAKALFCSAKKWEVHEQAASWMKLKGDNWWKAEAKAKALFCSAKKRERWMSNQQAGWNANSRLWRQRQRQRRRLYSARRKLYSAQQRRGRVKGIIIVGRRRQRQRLYLLGEEEGEVDEKTASWMEHELSLVDAKAKL